MLESKIIFKEFTFYYIGVFANCQVFYNNLRSLCQLSELIKLPVGTR